MNSDERLLDLADVLDEEELASGVWAALEAGGVSDATNSSERVTALSST